MALAAAAVLTWLALLAPLAAPWPHLASFLLLIIWPTLAWSKGQTGTLSERWLAGGAVTLLLNPMAILLISYLPGPVPHGLQTALHLAVVLLPLLWPSSGGVSGNPKGIKAYWPISLALLVLLTMRLPALGYSEFQGDEGVIMVRAAAMISGDDGQLFLHQKGPVEILLPMSLWNMAGSINEFWARLNFAWASGLAILAAICLARRWFGDIAGVITGVLFALSGFSVAFGRIVQYQSLIMLWGMAAVLFADRYRAGGKRSDLLMTAVFLAAGLLAHYDAVLVVPAVAWLLSIRLRRDRRIEWRAWASAAGSAVLILSLFYVPFALNPNFSRTGRYLLQARLGVGENGGLLSWSGPAVWQMLTFYNSTYYVVGLVLLILLYLSFRSRDRRRPEAILLFLTPLLFYLFIVKDPRTHVYTIVPGATILAAAGAVHLGTFFRRSTHRYLFAAALFAFAIFLLASDNYVYLLFIDHDVERQRTWAENRPIGYPTTWEEPPLYGLFGFPHQAGWRVVTGLLPENAYPYASNEEEEITNWYMNQAPRTHCANFNSFILARNAQDEVPYDLAWAKPENLQYQVMVNGRVSLQIFGRQPVDQVTTVVADDHVHWVTPAEVAPPTAGGVNPVNTVLGQEQVRLLGYDLDTSAAHPGGQIVVTLYWQALAPFERNYQTFVHVVGEELLAQHDGAPECNVNPTTRWQPGQVVPDPHIIPLEMGTPPGTYTLQAGMYDLLSLDPLPAAGTQEHLLPLQAVRIDDH